MLVYTRVNNLIMRVTSTTTNQPPGRISNSNPICYHNAGLWKVAGNSGLVPKSGLSVCILAHCSTNEELHYYSKPATSAAQGNSKMTQPKYLLTSSPQQIQRSLSRRLLQMVVGSVPPLHPPHLQAIRCTASVDPHLSAQHLHAVPSHLPGIRQWNQWVKNGSNGPKQPFLVANRFESFDPCLNLPKPKH